MHATAQPLDLMPLAVDALAWKHQLERQMLDYRAEELREIARLLQSVPVRVTGISLLASPRSRARHRDGYLSDDILIVATGLQGIEPVTQAALANVCMALYGTSRSGETSLYQHQQERWMLSVAWTDAPHADQPAHEELAA